MKSETRGQRWLQWRNVDTSFEPICPAFGCIEITGYETVGKTIILQGISAGRFDLEPNTAVYINAEDQVTVTHVDNGHGALWKHAFNGEVSVNPGEIGHCTFDLPTWVATNGAGPAGGFLGSLPVTVGNFRVVDATPATLADPTPTPKTYIGTYGYPWRVGSTFTQVGANSGAIIWNEAGWNCYYADPNTTPVSHTGQELLSDPYLYAKGKAWIGGARTFLQVFNRNTNER